MHIPIYIHTIWDCFSSNIMIIILRTMGKAGKLFLVDICDRIIANVMY